MEGRVRLASMAEKNGVVVKHNRNRLRWPAFIDLNGNNDHDCTRVVLGHLNDQQSDVCGCMEAEKLVELCVERRERDVVVDNVSR